nr:M23 family metallopeptidase [Candidatus Cloacimonadota bacterium]
MKKKILVFLVLCNTILVANISLNKYGHINYSEETLKTEYYIENGAYYINIDGNILIGNSLFEINNGFLTLSGEHENIPTRIRIYDNAGSVQFSKEFTKVINLKTSKNGKFTIFFDGNNVQVINNSNFKLEEFFRSVDFDINNFGEAILVDDNGKIIFEDHSYLLNLSIRKVLFHNDIPLIFTEHSIFQIEQKLQKMQSFTEDIFEAKIIENTIYLVIKNNSNYKLLKFNNSKNIEQNDEINFDSSRNRIHEPIYAPLNYGEEDFPFPIGNSYAEIQQYGDTPYLHPGVDFLGDDYQEVYAVHDGFVKAIITTGGDRYWRVAIANENTAVETEGYLYAHLNENSITVAVGDTVLAGELLGTLYPWGFADFTHIHFARVFCTGLEWFGDWWTTENSLLDVINIQDTIPPIFENAILNDKFAFRTELGDYLNSINLYGEFDIIAKCHDFANTDWIIDVLDSSY